MLREVTVENGRLQGIPAADPRITAFKGVPFAAPPVGSLRWHAPRPAANWPGTLKAFQFAPIGMQHIPGLDPNNIYTREWNVDPTIAMDEDCLYLNIWTPAKSADEKLPVYVWYFGGALIEGNTAEMEFDGERLARRGIILVTINYRLNIFGFMAHPEITAENPGAPTNFGHLDQRFGTAWVKRNIAAFGGDPDNITIGGQSAGGISVLTQLTANGNEGLFQKAITASGSSLGAYRPMSFSRRLADAEAEGVKFFNFLGVRSLAEARKLSAVVIRDKMLEYPSDYHWGTVIDDVFLSGDPMTLMVQNKRLPVPLMAGRTASEMPAVPPAQTIAEFEQFARARFGDQADRFLAICRRGGDSLEQWLAAATFSPMECGLRAIFHHSAQAGIQASMYYYVFDIDIPGWDNPGTFHSVDLWFWFETLAKCWRPFVGRHYDLSRQMCNYWANFVKTGDPNGLDNDGSPLPVWEPVTPAKPYAMVLKANPAMLAEGPSELMRFLLEIAAP
jgi:para-nitrobenzyl esterase